MVEKLEFLQAGFHQVGNVLEFEFYQDVGEILPASLFGGKGVVQKRMGCLVDDRVLGWLFHVFNVDVRAMAAVRLFHGKKKGVKLFKG